MTSPATDQPLKVVAVRLPQSLIDAAQCYADLYHSSVSTLLREGLELRLRPREGTSASDDKTALPPATLTMLTQLARTLTTAAIEVRTLCQETREPQMYNGNTETVEEAYDGNTLRATPGRLTTADLDTIPFEPDVVPAERPVVVGEGLPSAEACPPFDQAKYLLGRLCPKHHVHGATGQSLLRRTDRHCLICDREKTRAKTSKTKRQRARV